MEDFMEKFKEALLRGQKDRMDKVEQQATNRNYNSYMPDYLYYGVTNNTVYVIYTHEGPYDTAHSEEAAHELAKLYGLCPGTYKVVAEELNNY